VSEEPPAKSELLQCEVDADWFPCFESDWFKNEDEDDWLKFITGGSLNDVLGDFLLNELMKLWCVWVSLASSSKKLSPQGIGELKPMGVVFLNENALDLLALGELNVISVAGVEVLDNNND
jgi:hypothetical protein